MSRFIEVDRWVREWSPKEAKHVGTWVPVILNTKFIVYVKESTNCEGTKCVFAIDSEDAGMCLRLTWAEAKAVFGAVSK